MAGPGPNPFTFATEAAQFATTHWSLVLNAGAVESSTQCREALESLCRIYCRPLYAFARRTGHSPEEAQDLVQGFFLEIIETNVVAKADRERGRFRTFLLAAFKHFLSHERDRAGARKRGGDRSFVSLDEFEPEERQALEPIDALTPDTIYDQRWARQQIDNALQKVRADYVAASRGPLFDLLKDYLWGDRNSLSLAQIATQLDLTEEAVKKALQRLRERFRVALRGEIAQTVAKPDQIDDELRYLKSALASGG